jgi:hypothetical protein
MSDNIAVQPDLSPDTRCKNCGLRLSDHGKMLLGCFKMGRSVKTRFEAVDDSSQASAGQQAMLDMGIA